MPQCWEDAASQRGSALAQDHDWVGRQSDSDSSQFDDTRGNTQVTQSCSSLKLPASIPFPRTQLHPSSLFAGSKSSPPSQGLRCKVKHCFQGSQQLSDASQNDTKWAVQRSLLWVGPCEQYIKLLNVRHSSVQVSFAGCRTGMVLSSAKHLLPALWTFKNQSSSDQGPLWQTAHSPNNYFTLVN